MSFIKYLNLLLAFATILMITACQTKPVEKVPPNILWIYLEDTAPLLSCYGTSIISTPNIDNLAEQGMRFTNAIMPAPVCSPCRSSIVTGMMSTSLGVHNHHSSRTEAAAINLPDKIKTIPEVFRKEGYFTFNNGKDDYNFSYDRMDLYQQDYKWHPLYGKKGEPLDLSLLKNKMPFFGQIQLSGGKEIFSSTFKEKVKSPVDRTKVVLPPYLPNHPVIIEEYANHLDAIKITDAKVGAIMKELRDNDLLDNTIVFFFSDHGMRLTRNKQFLYEGGLKVPLIMVDFRADEDSKIKANTINKELISGLDLGTSSLALAGIEIPNYMEGENIFDDMHAVRDYVISTRDRCDFTIDRIRAVRSKDYKYIRNFMTDRAYTQPTYMDVDSVPFVYTMKQLYAANELDEVQARFFLAERPAEELYNLKEDPYELNNLAKNLKYKGVLKEHASVLNQWMEETDDKGQYPEDKENLKLMLGIWGKYAINPEYETLKKEYKNLAGSQFSLKREPWKKVSMKD